MRVVGNSIFRRRPRNTNRMQQPRGQFVYLNGGPVQQQHVGQNVVVMAPGQQPQQQFVVLAPAQTPMQVQTTGVNDGYSRYKTKTSVVMGAMQIVLALLMIGLNIGMAVVHDNSLWVISTGWWATPFMIIAGAFGIAAGTGPNRCKVVTTMVLSILCCVWMISVFTQAGLGIAARHEECRWIDDKWGWWLNCYRYQTDSNLALHITFILAGLTELGIGITQSVMCCRVLCCGKQTPQTYVTNHGQSYTNGGFVPCYIHPQGGATGVTTTNPSMQHVVMPTNVSMPANTDAMPTNVAMQTSVTMPTPETRHDEPPAYIKE